MQQPINGIHHVTAIASNPQMNLAFYTRLLGLRLVKQTVNFDDPSAYHLYYGDESGSAGTIVTFFYWPGTAARGRIGTGQSTALVFSAGPESLDYWEQRLRDTSLDIHRSEHLGEPTLRFADPDGIPIEIVGVADDTRPGWAGADIPVPHRLRGLHTVELAVEQSGPTEKLLLEQMGFRPVSADDDRRRFEAGPGGSGRYLDLIVAAGQPRGYGGSGTIHHVAWSVPDDPAELAMQRQLRAAGFGVSQVRDRDYFHSIYWPEPGGVLFEIATENPGFAVDEPLAQLGSTLKLPKQFEHARDAIQRALPPLNPAVAGN